MDLKQFVEESLRQILDGVRAAKEYGASIGADINPVGKTLPPKAATELHLYRGMGKGHQFAQNISFDVAVTTIEESKSKGGAKLAVAVFTLGGDKQSNSTNSSVSRVQFTVPVFLP